jgi:type IV fimbrial biogenesis protein FimT
MLTTRADQRGFSMVELMVALTIVGFAMAAGLPSLSAWLQNSKLRSSTESIITGLQVAKSEAVSRNALVRFQLTSSLDSSCTLSTSSANWVVNADPNPGTVAGKCDVAPSDTVSPFIIRKRDPTKDIAGMVVDSGGVSSITFNGLGRPTTPVVVGIDLSNPEMGACAPTGPVTCLRVVVSAAGQIRMCNPKFSLPDPQGC